MVMLDGELSGDVIEVDQLESVTVPNVELRLDGATCSTIPTCAAA